MPLRDLLEQRPEWGYEAWLQPYSQNMPPTFWDAMQRQYRQLYGGYQGRLGQDILAGRVPTLSWQDYLGELNPRQFYRGLSGYEQGQTSYSPIFRFIG